MDLWQITLGKKRSLLKKAHGEDPPFSTAGERQQLFSSWGILDFFVKGLLDRIDGALFPLLRWRTAQ
jgi:hypothetical protein